MKFKSLLLSAAAATTFALPGIAQEPAPAPAQEPAPAPSADVAQDGAVETPPALKEILNNVPNLLDKKWATSMNLQMTESESQSGTIDIDLKYQDMKHFMASVAFNMVDGEQTMKGDVKILSDGEFVFVDGTLPQEISAMMPPFPVKVKYDVLEKAMKVGMEAEGDEGLKDLLRKQLNDMLGGDSFQSFKEDGSTETDRRFAFSNDEAKGWISFGKKMWMPKSMEVAGNEGQVMKMSTNGSKFVETFPEGTFVFTVPEGKNVMDLTAMLQAQLPQDNAADEDLEF